MRVVLYMFTRDPESETAFQPGYSLGLAMMIAVIGLFFIGVYPTPLIEASESAAQVLTA
jgi:NADH:ubiquinone oxidoreductase subunit 2 (subunit N)